MKRSSLLCLGLITVLLGACSPSTGEGDGASSSSESQESSAVMIEESSSSSEPVVVEPSSSSQAPVVQKSSSSKAAVKSSAAAVVSSAPAATGPRTISIAVKDFSFTPNVIRVKKGEKITIKLNGEGGTHGFAVAGLGINASVSAGDSATVSLPTDKTGTFEFFCSIPCGSGHQSMRGQIIIEE